MSTERTYDDLIREEADKWEKSALCGSGPFTVEELDLGGGFYVADSTGKNIWRKDGGRTASAHRDVAVLVAARWNNEHTNDGWLPIDENTPRDRTIIFGWLDGRELQSQPCIGRYNDDRYSKKPRPFWQRAGLSHRMVDRANPPTHWQPLPANPRSKS